MVLLKKFCTEDKQTMKTVSGKLVPHWNMVTALTLFKIRTQIPWDLISIFLHVWLTSLCYKLLTVLFMYFYLWFHCVTLRYHCACETFAVGIRLKYKWNGIAHTKTDTVHSKLQRWLKKELLLHLLLVTCLYSSPSMSVCPDLAQVSTLFFLCQVSSSLEIKIPLWHFCGIFLSLPLNF